MFTKGVRTMSKITVWVYQRCRGIFYARLPHEPEALAVPGPTIEDAAKTLILLRDECKYDGRSEVDVEIVVEDPNIEMKLKFW